MTQVAGKLRIFAQLQRGLLFKYAWFRAWRTSRPVDATGKPLPWITYPAIDLLSQFDFSEHRCSNGQWFFHALGAKRCKRIVSVETSASFIPYIRTPSPPEVELLTPEFAEQAKIA